MTAIVNLKQTACAAANIKTKQETFRPIVARLWNETVTKIILLGLVAAGSWFPTLNAAEYPPLPRGLTSFGAAICGQDLYVYGGHTGDAHEYFQRAQGKTLWRLKLTDAKRWEKVSEGPPLQGLAMVTHADQLYRIGGFTARNGQGEKHDLWSQNGVSRYLPLKNQWQQMAPLPEGRSSFDAAVCRDHIYVIGGWNMAGPETSKWHKTAYSLDLNKTQQGWRLLPEPPFQRRALAVAAYQGMVYAIGGMQPKGGPTTRVDRYDPESRKWYPGPPLPGEGMEGFGCSAFAVKGNLYVSTISGKLHRLAKDGNSWDLARQLTRKRFFHRMLAIPSGHLILVGGACMVDGKQTELDLLDMRLSTQEN